MIFVIVVALVILREIITTSAIAMSTKANQEEEMWQNDEDGKNGENRRRENLAEKKTLEEFGYRFNELGQLRQIANPDAGFVYEVIPGDKNYNQKHYEALGEVITEEIYRLLETKTGLKKIYVPVQAEEGEPRGFFFASDDAWTADRLIILIHGSGVVRAGQWSRKLIMNDDIETGSQIPYIEYALESGFGVIVLNTNLNRALVAPNGRVGEEVYIKHSEDPLSHALYVWDNFIRGAAAKHIAFVAHSAGGYVTVDLAHDRCVEFIDRVFAVAFTDSVHSEKPGSPCWEHMLRVARNWVTSRKELGANEKRHRDDVDRVSAGTLSHEMTSASAFSAIRDFIRERYEEEVTVTATAADEEGEEILINEEVQEEQKAPEEPTKNAVFPPLLKTPTTTTTESANNNNGNATAAEKSEL